MWRFSNQHRKHTGCVSFWTGLSLALMLFSVDCGDDASAVKTCDAGYRLEDTQCVPIEPLTLVANDPAEGATGVGRATKFVLTFSTDLDPATVNAQNIKLSDAAGPHEVLAEVSGRVLTVTPRAGLRPLSAYTLNLSADLKSAAGGKLAQAVALHATAQDGMWGAPLPIMSDDKYAGSMQIAATRDGGVLAIFNQNENIWATSYDAKTGWQQPATLIGDPSASEANSPKIAADAQGNATAIWQQYDGSDAEPSVWSNRYLAGTGWGKAEAAERDSGGSAYNAGVAMDGLGNAVVVWQQNVGPRYDIWANHFSGAWRDAALIETDDAGGAAGPQVALNESGNGMAVWHQSDSARNNVWMRHYSATMGWSSQLLMLSDGRETSENPVVVMTSRGDAFVAWIQTTLSGSEQVSRLIAVRYVVGMGFQERATLEDDVTGTTESPAIAVDAKGNAMLTWLRHDGGRKELRVSRYLAGATWPKGVAVDPEVLADVSEHQLVLDLNGNGIAIWVQKENLWAKRYIAGTGWGPSALIERGEGKVEDIQLVIDASGTATATWRQSDGIRGYLWSNRFE